MIYLKILVCLIVATCCVGKPMKVVQIEKLLSEKKALKEMMFFPSEEAKAALNSVLKRGKFPLFYDNSNELEKARAAILQLYPAMESEINAAEKGLDLYQIIVTKESIKNKLATDAHADVPDAMLDNIAASLKKIVDEKLYDEQSLIWIGTFLAAAERALKSNDETVLELLLFLLEKYDEEIEFSDTIAAEQLKQLVVDFIRVLYLSSKINDKTQSWITGEIDSLNKLAGKISTCESFSHMYSSYLEPLLDNILIALDTDGQTDPLWMLIFMQFNDVSPSKFCTLEEKIDDSVGPSNNAFDAFADGSDVMDGFLYGYYY